MFALCSRRPIARAHEEDSTLPVLRLELYFSQGRGDRSTGLLALSDLRDFILN